MPAIRGHVQEISGPTQPVKAAGARVRLRGCHVPIDRGHRQPRVNEKPVTALGWVTAFLRSHVVTTGRATGIGVR